jgi:hypothetical protein
VHIGQHELARIALEHLGRLPGARVLFGALLAEISQDSHGVTVTAITPVAARSSPARDNPLL